MTRSRLAVLVCVPLVSACAYHNVIHNAQRLFDNGEEYRQAGQDSLSREHFTEVVRKTGEAYRARPESEWACDALILLGRSQLRLGDLRAARAAFEQAGQTLGPCEARPDLDVHFAAVALEMGDAGRALERLNAALDGELSDRAAAEAHLLRGGILLERSLVEHGWWDLDRAIDIDSGLRTSAGLTALRWSVAQGDREAGRRAVDRLFSYREAGARADSVVALTEQARRTWSAAEAAELLAGVDDAAWNRAARGGVALHRAALLHEAGDTADARRQATRVASGLGITAADARLMLAGWRFARALDLQQLSEVRTILLPEGGDPRVAALLADLAQVDDYANAGLDDPIGLFAAGEIARDRLEANQVARGLMLAYADGPHDEPWKAKAILAALELTESVGDRAWLLGRLEAYPDNPYVLAALGDAAAGFEALEEELEVRLDVLAR